MITRPRRQTYTMKQYLDNVKEGFITNNVDTQRNPAYKPIIDGLSVTTVTGDYVPTIILAEDGSGQIQIVDGGSRTAAFMMIRYGNYKIKSSVENPIIYYKKMNKDTNGKITWEDAEFDIRNKTFEQFPKELQKAFDEYQIETVIHECDSDRIAMYLRRYNVHTSMNAHQKMFIYLPKFAGKIREMINRPFFLNNTVVTDNEKEKGMLERIVAESAMCIYHLDKWNKNGKTMATYLNTNASYEEFEQLENNLSRLENIITDDTKDIFNSKDSFIWLTFFDKFTKLGVDDSKFAEFLHSFKNGLRNKVVDGQLFDTVDQSGSTKDKAIIIAKLNILETLLHDFLHIKEEDLEEIDTLNFVRDNAVPNATEEDVEFYEEILDDITLEVDNDTRLLDKHNRPSLVALVGYACCNEIDVELEEWLKKWFMASKMYLLNQKRNFELMKDNFQKGVVS